MSDGTVTNTKYIDFLNNPESYSQEEFSKLFSDFKSELNKGKIRVAEKIKNKWKVNYWVKQFILHGFRYGTTKEYGSNCEDRYFDKSTLGKRELTYEDGVRVVSQSATIRDGVYIAPGVICMPPCFINIGAYVSEDTLIDSNTLVGSCAQIGKRVHLSAGSQIGGVLEPVGEFPVIIEDNVFIGGNCGIYDGTIIKKGAVIGAGTIITGSIGVFDIVHNRVYSRTDSKPLTIPEGAVVVPGARMIEKQIFDNVKLSLQTPIIIKYVKSGNANLQLEDALREI
ncbi:hypothetical protein A7W90_11050 [Clostridium sp. Bc-iso-3]|nr:hypothetical protein A7W90_11050 [Clostridium sp. Bc-iso-3]